MRVPTWLVQTGFLLVIIIAVALFLNRDVLLGESPQVEKSPPAEASRPTQPSALQLAAPADTPPGEEPASVAEESMGGAGEAVSAKAESPTIQAPPAGEAEAAVPQVAIGQILQTWRQARIAAWQGGFAKAIEHYRTILTLQPDNFDAYGEMGNVLLMNNDPEGAAEAYYQAALRIGNTPYYQYAWNLLGVVAGLDSRKADILYQELRGQARMKE